MKAERWRQIEDLYHAALGRAPGERAPFVAGACAGDEELRREVETLLASHERASTFIEEPVAEAAARLFADDQTRSMLGRQVGHYKILSLLGTGGMGEVYLAQDTSLGRRVAIKVLLASFSTEEDRVRRFQQEARAASALNHPNILTVHEIGQIDGRHFIATEFIDGLTLREHASGRGLRLEEVLDVGIQVASALTKAHAAGIAHRDIKPENIMVDADGHVKVLDFGLAKQTGSPAAAGEEASTRAMVKTDPGMVMGTVSYMSPEQARGLEVDARTDIWSLGVVLYEMVAGRVPFEGPTTSHVIVSILEKEPPPLRAYSEEVPAEMERIVSRALNKERAGRYQTAKELLGDLRALKHRLELESELGPALPAHMSGGAQTALKTRAMAAGTGGVEAGRQTSSIEYIITEITRRKKGVALALAALVIAVAGVGFGVYRFVGRRQSNAAMKMTRLTADGRASNAAISPDGKYVVYAVSEAGQQSLWVKQVATGSNVQIVAPAQVRYPGLTFSPDGNYVYYVAIKAGEQTGALYLVPALGGDSRKVLAEVNNRISFSPDGRRFACLRTLSREEKALVVVNADGTGERRLVTRRAPNFFLGAPAWSPDGKTVAHVGAILEGSLRRMEVFAVPVEGGAEKPVTSQVWNGITHIEWLGDATGLVMIAREKQSDQFQIWQLSYPDGEARMVTNDLSRYESLSVAGDSESLVTVRNERNQNIWVVPVGEASQARQITSGGKGEGVAGLAWTPDGRIVYSISHSIWIMGADGAGQKQLTIDPHTANYFPAVSPDNRYIVFTSFRENISYIWRMDIDGSNLKQLTEGFSNLPQFSPDGQWVVYESESSGTPTVWKVAIDGGAPVQLTDKYSRDPTVSPDGKLVACNYRAEANAPSKVALIPFEGGEPVKVLDLPTDDHSYVYWTSDGRALSYIGRAGGGSNIWTQPLDGGKPVPVTDFKTDKILNFAWSKDSKQLAVARGTMTTDVVLIKDFR